MITPGVSRRPFGGALSTGVTINHFYSATTAQSFDLAS